jgi:hypothetical protein
MPNHVRPLTLGLVAYTQRAYQGKHSDNRYEAGLRRLILKRNPGLAGSTLAVRMSEARQLWRVAPHLGAVMDYAIRHDTGEDKRFHDLVIGAARLVRDHGPTALR